MKKTNHTPRDDMRSEYDFASMKGGVRGKYFKRFREGTNIVLVEPEVAEAFPTESAVNEALRGVLNTTRAVRRTGGPLTRRCSRRARRRAAEKQSTRRRLAAERRLLTPKNPVPNKKDSEMSWLVFLRCRGSCSGQTRRPARVRLPNLSSRLRPIECVVTIEDVPPKSIGGRPLVLTCRWCNHRSGQLLDANIRIGRDLNEVAEGKRDTCDQAERVRSHGNGQSEVRSGRNPNRWGSRKK